MAFNDPFSNCAWAWFETPASGSPAAAPRIARRSKATQLPFHGIERKYRSPHALVRQVRQVGRAWPIGSHGEAGGRNRVIGLPATHCGLDPDDAQLLRIDALAAPLRQIKRW